MTANEKALSGETLKAKRKRPHIDSAPETYHVGSGTATTRRVENSLAGRSTRLDLESRPVVTDPRPISHSRMLIATAVQP